MTIISKNMKKLFIALLAMLSLASARAITVEEAFARISEIPGVALSDFPEYDCLKEGLDWGKSAMLLGSNAQTLATLAAIEGEITDEKAIDVKDASGVNATIYVRPAGGDRMVGLIIVTMQMQGQTNAVSMLCQGGENLVETLKVI